MDSPTFVGPVTRARSSKIGGGFTIVYLCGVVQGTSYVSLTAPSRVEALGLRADYVKAGAEPVPTQRLLTAIAEALKLTAEAHSSRRAA